MKSLQERFKIKSYETDENAKLKPQSLMLLMQESANQHADALGFGYDQLLEKGIIWVLSRAHVVFERIPDWREEVVLETWHKGSDKLFGLRDYSLTGLTGEGIAKGTTSWLIIGTENRRLQRIEQHLGNDHPSVHMVHAIEEPAPKLAPPQEIEFVKSREVEYSDIDMNHHTNNSRYMEWALDCINKFVPERSFIKEFAVNFNSESRLGERLDHYACKTSSGAFFEARRGETSVVQIEFIFSGAV
jgi:acyl-ACP thioesterase